MPDALLPFIPTAANLRIFLLGLLWACLGGLAAAAMEFADDLMTFGDDPINWGHVGRLALAGATPLAVGYWRKYKALITEPPVSEVVELAKGAAA